MARYLIEREFPDGLRIPQDQAGASLCRAVVENNAEDGVTWVHSPTPEAVRHAAARNKLPILKIVEVRVLDPYFYCRLRRQTMKSLIALTAILFAAQAFAADAPVSTPAPQSKTAVHRYLVERTFPPDALKGLDAATKKKVNANNASVGVRWVESYANAAETKTFCVYEGPNEAAIRKAAELNKLPVDSITEVPVTLTPQ